MGTETKKRTFDELRKIDVSAHTEKKNGLSYLSWAWAVDTLLENDPSAVWEYKEEKRFGETLMVFCTVTAFGKSMTAQLPVMDYRNKAIPNPDAFQVNTAMQRCLAKAIALHGIGLYIYAGEDVPKDGGEESSDEWENTKVRVPKKYWDAESDEEKQALIGAGNKVEKVSGEYKDGGGWYIFSKKSEAEEFVKNIKKPLPENALSLISHDEQLELFRLIKVKNVDPELFKAFLKDDLKVAGTNKITKEMYLKVSEWILAHERDAQ
jgi:hypothetical protein